MVSTSSGPRGRGAGFNPANQYQRFHYAETHLPETVDTKVYRDSSDSILAKNQSPDVPFTYSLNPYRGCEHGCIYCYARPSHEYLGFSSGVDFESRIVVKENAPRLLKQRLQKSNWDPQPICLSGNTDPYQPLEQQLELTRGCLKVFERFKNPVSVITKNHRITRDLDLLSRLAEQNLVRVRISVTTLDRELARIMEPRTSPPKKRLDAMKKLSSAGVSVGINAAPVIPGLTDHELPNLLEAGAEAGAKFANYIIVRLPGSVEELFLEWLEQNLPDRKNKILNQIRSIRNGKLSESRFGKRMKGEGTFGEFLEQIFQKQCRRLGLNERLDELTTEAFSSEPDQRTLF